MRRSTYVGGAGGNLRASMHRNSNHGGGGGTGLPAGRGASFHGGDSMPLQHSNGHGAAVGTPGGAGANATGGPSLGRAVAVAEKRWGTLIVELLEEEDVGVSFQADEQLWAKTMGHWSHFVLAPPPSDPALHTHTKTIGNSRLIWNHFPHTTLSVPIHPYPQPTPWIRRMDCVPHVREPP